MLLSGQLLYKGRPASQEIMQLMPLFYAYGSYAIIRQWILEDIPLAPEEVADLLAGSFNQDFTFQERAKLWAYGPYTVRQPKIEQ